jgi:hypothetical protein
VDTGIVILQYAVYLLEAGVLAYVLLRRRHLRLLTVCIYLGLLLAVDGISRPYFLYRFGFESREYAYFFWLSDVLLALAAFALIAFFFRRACAQQPSMWHHVRLLLTFVLILVAGVSLLSLSRNFDQLFTRFIIEFQQNLYFTCLVLNTLLFILIQHLEIADEELTLLVCGMGIQFAGPAATFALLHLSQGYGVARPITTYLGPLCTLGMLLTWFYAVARPTQSVLVPEGETQAGALAAVADRQV